MQKILFYIEEIDVCHKCPDNISISHYRPNEGWMDD